MGGFGYFDEGQIFEMPTFTICRDWEDYSKNDFAESYSDRAEMLTRLIQLSETRPSEEETRIIFEHSHKRYLATPLMLALLLKEYLLAERLLEAGYHESKLHGKGQYLASPSYDYCLWVYQEIHLLHLLIMRPDMPESLFDRLCKEGIGPEVCVNLWRDFLENPFSETILYRNKVNEELPDFRGLDRIYYCDSKRFEHFLDSSDIRQFPYFLPELREDFYNHLLKYTSDSEKSIECLLSIPVKDYIPRLIQAHQDDMFITLWIKQLHQFQKKYQDAEQLQFMMFWHSMDLVYLMQCLNRGCRRPISPNEIEQLALLISLTRPEQYDFEVYLEEISRKIEDFTDYVRYLKGWNMCVKEPMKIRRTDQNYWNIVCEIATIKAVEAEFVKNARLETLKEWFDLPIEFFPMGPTDKIMNEHIVGIFPLLTQYDNEELIVSFLKRDMIPAKQLSQYIDIAIEQRQLKLVPVMTGYQAIQKEGEE